jgi:hypothetical protein
MPASTGVVSCYEAGRDGFWLHRHLRRFCLENEVLDAASIEVSRRLRHVKTDRLDGIGCSRSSFGITRASAALERSARAARAHRDSSDYC